MGVTVYQPDTVLGGVTQYAPDAPPGVTVFPSGVLPIPPLTDLLGMWSTFGVAAGWQNGAPLVNADTNDRASTASSPYPLDWAAITNGATLDQWYDQSGGTLTAAPVTNVPTVNTVTERFDFNGTDQSLFATVVPATQTLTIYEVFKADTLAALQTLFQNRYEDNYLTSGFNSFAAYITAAGVLTVTQKTDDVVDLFNSKIYTLGDTNLHLLITVFDRSIAGADATKCKIDNSTTGWSNGSTSNMTGDFSGGRNLSFGQGNPLGTGNAFLDGSLVHRAVFNAVHNDTQQTAWYEYLKFLYPDIS